MSLCAIDIETASPNTDPLGDMQNTANFELVAVGLGYQPHDNAPVETTVLTREKDWGLRGTTELIFNAINWLKEREPKTTLTYNGNGFDKIHLLNWANQADEQYKTDIATDYNTVFSNHIDLIRPAANVYGDNDSYLKLEDALEAANITFDETYYRDYALPDEFIQQFNSPFVTNKAIGTTLGETYVEECTGDSPTPKYNALGDLLYDYTAEDIEPLFGLANTLRTEAI